MKKFNYKVKTGEALNMWKLSEFNMRPFMGPIEAFEHPVNLEETYIQVVYPQRREYLKQLSAATLQDVEYKNLYIPFENRKVDFSTFIKTTHEISFQGEVYLESLSNQLINFELKTCGALDIFVNNEHKIFYAPMTRNLESCKTVSIPLEKGINKVNVVARELAERDVLFNFEMTNMSSTNLNAFILVEDDDLENKINILNSLAFNKDEYTSTDEITISYDNELLQADTNVRFASSKDLINPVHGGAEYSIDVTLSKSEGNVCIPYNQLPIGTYKVSMEIDSCDGVVSRQILISKYIDSPKTLSTFEQRKEYLLENLESISPNNITKSLLYANKLEQQEIVDNELLERFQECYDHGLDFIDEHGDCSDFHTVPLLMLLMKHQKIISEDNFSRAKEVMLNFRYFLDEPGDDAMWWFSENHAFLFHISQYFAGYMFKEEKFVLSERLGEEQFNIGKERILEWFETFKKYQFAEWNSTTYFPVDLIGFIALYECAPDQKIKDLAFEALELTFEIIQKNMHHNIMGTTYGRVYEKELKGLRNGELCAITWLYFNKGYFNNTNRAIIMLALSNYVPTRYNDYSVDEVEEYETYYEQGFNKVGCYIYKNKNYSISGVINYSYKRKGHQQHMMNISFSKDEIQLWLNNPGEKMYSGEGRPAFWAGNGINPQIFIDKNVMIYNFDNENSVVKYSHLYFPTFMFENYLIEKSYVIAENKGAYFGMYSTCELSLTTSSAIKDREIKINGDKGAVVIIMATKEKYKTIADFEQYISKTSIAVDNDSTASVIGNTKYLITNNQFYKNNKLFDYTELA